MLISYHYCIVFCLFVLSVKLTQTQQPQDLSVKFDVTLAGTNDIHGTAYPTILSRKDTGERYTYGGLIYMAKIIEILKEQNQGNLLYVDAGDQFQGGLEASKLVSSGQIISDYFNHMNTQANAIGNHQFDFGPQFLENYLQKLDSNILSANLIDTANEQLPLQKQQASKIYKFPITDRSPYIDQNFTELSIGVIGLSTVETPRTSSGFVDGLFPSTYKFADYKQKVLQEAEKLKSRGAHALVLVTHVGNACNNNSDYGIWTLRNQTPNIPCQKEDEMFQLLDSLPDGLIDAVVQGHRHTQSHYFYKGIPIIGTINGGYYLNTIRLRFTLSRSTAFLSDDDLLIQGPIPVCQRIFSGTNKCDYIAPQNLQTAGELISWKFHQKLVQADQQLEQLYIQKYSQIMKQYEYEIADNYIPTPMVKDYEANSTIGNLITNVMANSIRKRLNPKIDFVILNGGGFRTTWYPGVVRYAQLHSMFPFDNIAVEFKISGRDLKKIFEIIQNGQKRYYPTWGLQQILVKQQSAFIKLDSIKHTHLMSQKMRRQSQQFYHIKQLISTLTKEPILDEKIYIGATLQFLLNGGDDFSKIINQPEEIKIFDRVNYSIMMKDLIKLEMEDMKVIDQKDLIGPNNMDRIIFQD